MNKSEFLKRLREFVAEGSIDEALDWLYSHNESFATYFSNAIFMLKNQFNSANNQFVLQGVIEYSVYSRIIARISLAILDLADKIEKKIEPQTVRGRGHLLHKIPSKMVKEKEINCIVRIAYTLENLLQNIKIDIDTVTQEIQVTKVMSVELIDNNKIETFKVRTCFNEEQFLFTEEYTQWIFHVCPLREGCFPLLLKIAAIEVIDGKDRKRVVVLEKKITIISENTDLQDSNSTSTNPWILISYHSGHISNGKELDTSLQESENLFDEYDVVECIEWVAFGSKPSDYKNLIERLEHRFKPIDYKDLLERLKNGKFEKGYYKDLIDRLDYEFNRCGYQDLIDRLVGGNYTYLIKNIEDKFENGYYADLIEIIEHEFNRSDYQYLLNRLELEFTMTREHQYWAKRFESDVDKQDCIYLFYLFLFTKYIKYINTKHDRIVLLIILRILHK